MKYIVPVKTRVSTRTVVSIALIAGAGIMAAAGFTIASSFKSTPALLVRATPAQPTHRDAVLGSSDIPLLSLEMVARGGTAEVNQITLSVFGDSDADFSVIDRDIEPEDRFTQCTLQDTDGRVVAGPEPISSGTLTFADPFSLTEDISSIYEVHCDLSNDPLVGGDEDRFAIALESETGFDATIGGTVLSGTSLVIGKTGTDTLNDSGEISLLVHEKGKMIISLASDTPPSNILLGETAENQIGRFDIRALGEDFHIDTITFDVKGDIDPVASVSLVCGSGPDLTSHTSKAFPSEEGRIVFTSANCDALATEDHVTLEVYTDINELDSSGSTTSGDKFQFALNALDTGTFEAVGATSGASYTETDLGVIVSTPEMSVRESKPQFSFATSPTTSVAPGIIEAFRFDITADSGGSVRVTQLLFKISTTDNDASGWNLCGNGSSPIFAKTSLWNLYDLSSDPTVPVNDPKDWIFLKADGKPCTGSTDPVAYALLNLNQDATHGGLTLSGGYSTTYNLKIDTSGASAISDDSLSVELLSEKEAFSLKQKAVIWDDIDGGVTGINGYLLQALPLTGETMQF